MSFYSYMLPVSDVIVQKLQPNLLLNSASINQGLFLPAVSGPTTSY